ncbi:hypothetical protein [Nocardia arthritidis]|uniref:Uncharacterized protein n=1 Tax=Nocardia arthritidis TaxID=228602 RepID=A0A6G9YCK6_9NOCA|nr:hypothetical protein [Nocardia arthritidis]QIS10894.1 hypothetical protein F5544_15050 [Nocardia arthritidis]
MRRSMYAVPIGFAVAALVCAPGAHAAGGDLIVNGSPFSDPAGCVFLGADDVYNIQNNTGSVITLYTKAECDGDSTAILSPGDSGSYTAKSALVG